MSCPTEQLQPENTAENKECCSGLHCGSVDPVFSWQTNAFLRIEKCDAYIWFEEWKCGPHGSIPSIDWRIKSTEKAKSEDNISTPAVSNRTNYAMKSPVNLSEFAWVHKAYADSNGGSHFVESVRCAFVEGTDIDGCEAMRLKEEADRGNAFCQNNYGVCLEYGIGVEIDLLQSSFYYQQACEAGDSYGQLNFAYLFAHGLGCERDLSKAAHYYKLSADQGNSFGQWRYGECLEYGIGVVKDFHEAAHYYKLSADQGNCGGLSSYGKLLFDGRGVSHDRAKAIYYFKQSADQGDAIGQYLYGHCLFLGQTVDQDRFQAGQLFEKSANRACRESYAAYGYCLREGFGVPQDFTLSAEQFKLSALCGNADGFNLIGSCYETGEGVERNCEDAVRYYKQAAEANQNDGIKNLGRCYEYGLGVECRLIKAAKYYKRSADMKDAESQNNYGLCLESGRGVKRDLALAAFYYKQSADQGYYEGENNYGYCAEHGQGIEKNIKIAHEYYERAASHGHSEAKLNALRCRRLLGCWNPPDRSKKVCRSFPRFDVREGKVPKVDGIASLIERSPMPTEKEPNEPKNESRDLTESRVLGGAPGRTMMLLDDSMHTRRQAVRVVSIGPHIRESKQFVGFDQEVAIHQELQHPLIIGLGQVSRPSSDNREGRMKIEYASNGSLGEHFSVLRREGPTLKTKIVVGIVLGMRFIHSRNIIHCNLSPSNILFDSNWYIRLSNFSHSVYFNPNNPPKGYAEYSHAHYSAPECFDPNGYTPAIDVFSFGLILYEFVVGFPAISSELSAAQAMYKISVHGPPVIPQNVDSNVRTLISACLAMRPKKRPTFDDILERFRNMKYELFGRVNVKTIERFVEWILTYESKS
jgi:TPR repeat protein/serine/threonine protein kinase